MRQKVPWQSRASRNEAETALFARFVAGAKRAQRTGDRVNPSHCSDAHIIPPEIDQNMPCSRGAEALATARAD